MIQKHTATLALTMLLLTASAQAEAPTSQFGFKGWPYRQNAVCATEAPDSHETPLPRPESTVVPPVTTTNEPVYTTKPSAAPTSGDAIATPVITATSQPTHKPANTPTVTSAQPTQNPSNGGQNPSVSVSSLEKEAWNLLNEDRARNGLAALPIDPELSRIARIKSEDMRDNGYFAHESPTYGRVTDMLRHFGYSFKGAGENIAHHATVLKSQAAFMSSSGHRRNILSTAWTKVGIGVCTDRNGFVYVTQIFAR